MKPNAFNALHQLQKRLKLGEHLDGIMSAWDSPKTIKSIFGMSPAESQAVQNLVHFIPPLAVQKFQRAVAEYGIVRGPISHAGLASEALRVWFSANY